MSHDATDLEAALAEEFDRNLDPLADLAPKFHHGALSKFDYDDYHRLFVEKELEPNDPDEKTLVSYERTWTQWCDFMDEQGRHPCCPNEHHVADFGRYLRDERGNANPTIEGKFWHLGRMYALWRDSAAFPHGDEGPEGYHPINEGRKKVSLEEKKKKDPPYISVEELREKVNGIDHLRDQAIVATQIKLGMRATEVCNIKVEDIHISNRELLNYYPQMGEAEGLDGREDAIYIPSKYVRDGNKSERPRVLPLDEDLRRVLTRYLLIRPDNERTWVYLSKSNHSRLDDGDVNAVWREHFRPEYDETSQHRAVTSHYGRHKFTSFWEKEGINRQLIKYMRGDKNQDGDNGKIEAMDTYIHVYYEDIEDVYHAKMFRLNL